jgi:hypothetical protein
MTAQANLKHIVINNGAHDSVGGQPTGTAESKLYCKASRMPFVPGPAHVIRQRVVCPRSWHVVCQRVHNPRLAPDWRRGAAGRVQHPGDRSELLLPPRRHGQQHGGD